MPTTQEEIKAFLQRLWTIKHLDTESQTLLKQLFKKSPELWHIYGDLARHARNQMAEKYAGDQAAVRVALDYGLAEMQQDLGYATAPALEKLLIEQILCCWLNVYDVQRRYTNVMSESHTLTLGTYWEKRLSSAQHRYLRACEALARVRKLAARAPLQINIADQQVNMVNPPQS